LWVGEWIRDCTVVAVLPDNAVGIPNNAEDIFHTALPDLAQSSSEWQPLYVST
jgi:hypothetical protein